MVYYASAHYKPNHRATYLLTHSLNHSLQESNTLSQCVPQCLFRHLACVRLFIYAHKIIHTHQIMHSFTHLSNPRLAYSHLVPSMTRSLGKAITRLRVHSFPHTHTHTHTHVRTYTPAPTHQATRIRAYAATVFTYVY